MKKLCERIFFLPEKLHLSVDTRWLHCNTSRSYTFNNDSRGNAKTVTTGSASLDTCKSARRALDSENIEANVAWGAFLFSPGRSFHSRRFSPSRGIIRSALYSSFPRKGPSPVKVSRLFEPDNRRIEPRQESSCALSTCVSRLPVSYTVYAINVCIYHSSQGFSMQM